MEGFYTGKGGFVIGKGRFCFYKGSSRTGKGRFYIGLGTFCIQMGVVDLVRVVHFVFLMKEPLSMFF